MKNIVIFASGNGTNAQRIIEFSKSGKSAFVVSAVFCNNPNAYVIHRAKQLDVPSILFNQSQFAGDGSDSVMANLAALDPDLIVLAGFLWLVPRKIVETYPDRIINIHPALLPKYGGKGMYGDRVHQAVLDHQEPESGITVHYVSEKYDDGDIVAQYKCAVDPSDTVETLASKIHLLEHEWFPKVIDDLCRR
jgi:phosphoribosylglycinamide formyltransferase-1